MADGKLSELEQAAVDWARVRKRFIDADAGKGPVNDGIWEEVLKKQNRLMTLALAVRVTKP